AAGPSPKIRLGTTAWGEPVIVPAREILNAHGLVTGSTGSGKTRFALVALHAVIDQLPQNPKLGFGIIDPKGELYDGVLYLLMRYATEILRNETLRRLLLARSKDDELVSYFTRQFAEVPKATVPAICRRLDALFSSDGVRLALSGNTAPDFRRLQDEGCIVL